MRPLPIRQKREEEERAALVLMSARSMLPTWTRIATLAVSIP